VKWKRRLIILGAASLGRDAFVPLGRRSSVSLSPGLPFGVAAAAAAVEGRPDRVPLAILRCADAAPPRKKTLFSLCSESVLEVATRNTNT